MSTSSDAGFLIKICGITNEKDAQAAVDAGANALGFNFFLKSPRYIPPVRAAEIVRTVSGNFLRVGVFVNASFAQLVRVASEVPLDVLQLHGDACDVPRNNAYRIWKAIPPSDRPMKDSAVEAYLLDTVSLAYGGSGKTFNWGLAADFPHRAIIAGGLDAENVAEAIETGRPWGVDACSRLEFSPGKKDPHRVRDFVQAALAVIRPHPNAEWTSDNSHRAAQEIKS